MMTPEQCKAFDYPLVGDKSDALVTWHLGDEQNALNFALSFNR